jgi:DtxR family Mn-dependent transcriptional regulator
MATPTEENYLKALLALADEEGKASVSELAQSLGVSTPSANSMVRKLNERGWVDYRKYKPLTLTEAGRTAAALVVRKHRLTEMYLVERMGFGWEEVHTIAEQIEHVDSPAFFARMDQLMGHPTVDPHGSPIPTADGRIAAENYRPLSEIAVGQTVYLRALGHSSNDFLHFLNDRSLALHTELTVIAREAFDGSVTVAYDDHAAEVLSQIAASQLLVEATD